MSGFSPGAGFSGERGACGPPTRGRCPPSWTSAVCDGSCDPCGIFVYRRSDDQGDCHEAETLLAKLGMFDHEYVDCTADGERCYTYRVEIRRLCTEQKPDGEAACSVSVTGCVTCPCSK